MPTQAIELEMQPQSSKVPHAVEASLVEKISDLLLRFRMLALRNKERGGDCSLNVRARALNAHTAPRSSQHELRQRKITKVSVFKINRSQLRALCNALGDFLLRTGGRSAG
eukprot:2687623-Rhodomonas_salina.1